jgi:hypothetical protein
VDDRIDGAVLTLIDITQDAGPRQRPDRAKIV